MKNKTFIGSIIITPSPLYCNNKDYYALSVLGQWEIETGENFVITDKCLFSLIYGKKSFNITKNGMVKVKKGAKLGDRGLIQAIYKDSKGQYMNDQIDVIYDVEYCD